MHIPNYFSDITKEGDIKDALAEIESKFSRLDTAVSCAGIGVAFKTYNFNKGFAHSLEDFTKGQLISKCPFGFIVSTKIPTKKFDKFCPRMGRADFVKYFRWYFGRNNETKRTF